MAGELLIFGGCHEDEPLVLVPQLEQELIHQVADLGGTAVRMNFLKGVPTGLTAARRPWMVCHMTPRRRVRSHSHSAPLERMPAASLAAVAVEEGC
jgi:hypothetical protein